MTDFYLCMRKAIRISKARPDFDRKILAHLLCELRQNRDSLLLKEIINLTKPYEISPQKFAKRELELRMKHNAFLERREEEFQRILKPLAQALKLGVGAFESPRNRSL